MDVVGNISFLSYLCWELHVCSKDQAAGKDKEASNMTPCNAHTVQSILR